MVSGDIVACDLVRKACQRHLNDLVEGPLRGLTWKPESAQYAINFVSKFLRHSKGEWARKPFVLSPWQKFIRGCVFGWKKADGTRRFNYVYQEVPRKNGKTTDLAGVGIYMLVCDGEGGAEVYSAATKKEQARLIFDEAKRMVAASPPLSALPVKRFKLNMSVDRTASKFEPLASDDKTLDGLNPHCVLVDELHKHPNRAVLDVLDTAVGSRRQPLIWIITTAGDDSPETVYAQENEYATKILEGVVEDDSVFAFIATIDKNDKWDDPVAWAKANPNLGISVKLADLERQARKAAKSPSALSAFKRLRLNVRSAATERAIEMALWNANNYGRIDPASLAGRRCWGGIDLALKTDISASVFLFEPEEKDGPMPIVARFWMPADTIEARSERDKVQYQRWVDEGHIEVTVGNVIDHNEIQNAVLQDADRYDIASIGYDPWSATQLAVSLNEQGVPMVEFVQGIRSYSEPTKELLSLLAAGKLNHGGNPVLAWMASNLKVQRDKNENMMPHKSHSTGRVDGITALIMAIGRMLNPAEDKPAHQLIII